MGKLVLHKNGQTPQDPQNWSLPTPHSNPSRRQAINRDNPRRNAMGTVKVTIAVGDSQGRQFEELDVTVDTGSTYTEVNHEKPK